MFSGVVELFAEACPLGATWQMGVRNASTVRLTHEILWRIAYARD